MAFRYSEDSSGYNRIVLIETEEQFNEVIPFILDSGILVVDVETNGLDDFGFNTHH